MVLRDHHGVLKAKTLLFSSKTGPERGELLTHYQVVKLARETRVAKLALKAKCLGLNFF